MKKCQIVIRDFEQQSKGLTVLRDVHICSAAYTWWESMAMGYTASGQKEKKG